MFQMGRFNHQLVKNSRVGVDAPLELMISTLSVDDEIVSRTFFWGVKETLLFCVFFGDVPNMAKNINL